MKIQTWTQRQWLRKKLKKRIDSSCSNQSHLREKPRPQTVVSVPAVQLPDGQKTQRWISFVLECRENKDRSVTLMPHSEVGYVSEKRLALFTGSWHREEEAAGELRPLFLEELLVEKKDEEVDVDFGFVKHLHDCHTLVLQLQQVLQSITHISPRPSARRRVTIASFPPSGLDWTGSGRSGLE